MTTPAAAEDPLLDTVLGKAVAILHAFGPEDHVLALTDLVRRTGLHKATVHRLAGSLVDVRLLERAEAGYRLSRTLFELGMRASVERDLMEMAIPFLQDLYERTHETVHLGIRDGVEVVYVTKIGGHRQASAPSRTGGRMPLHCTAIGKALLASSDPDVRREVLEAPMERRTRHTVVAPGLLARQLAQVAATGVAFEREESRLGLTCVAAPVHEGDVGVAAISLAGPTTRFRPEQHATLVRATAAALSSALTRRRRLVGEDVVT